MRFSRPDPFSRNPALFIDLIPVRTSTIDIGIPT